jgi:spermidine synthase
VPLVEKRRPEAFGLGLGAWATAAQVVLVREAIEVSSGNELVLGLAFALWLCGVGAGAATASRRIGAGAGLFAAQLASGPVTFAALAVLRFHRELLGVPPGGLPGPGAAAAILAAAFVPAAFLVGFSFTAAARIAPEGEGRPATRIYVAEAAGALAMGLAFSLVLSTRLDHVTVVALAYGAALIGFGITANRPAARAAALAIAGAVLIAAASGAASVVDAAMTARAFGFDPTRGELVAAADSAYGRLALGERDGQYSLFVDGRPEEVFPDPWERPVQVHLALTEHPHPKRVLLVGGGPPDRLGAALAHGVERVVLTYLDGAEHTLCAPFWPAETRRAIRDPRAALVRDDGRRYIATAKERFDVVVIASPPPRTGRANRYHTRELFAAVRRVLNPGGVVAVRAPGGANVLADEAARAAASTWRAVIASFPATILLSGTETTILAAVSPGDLTDDPGILIARFRARVSDPGGFVPERFVDLLDAERSSALRRRLETTRAPANTDERPYAYLAGVELWERQVESGAGRAGDTASGIAARWAWLLLALPLALWIVWRLAATISGRRGAGDALFSIATTGAAGMATELMILYAFQTAAGVLYTALAGIGAAFMAGLAVGATLGSRALGDGRPRSVIVADAAVLALLFATGPILGAALERAWLAAIWSAVAGVVTGAAFPAFLASVARRRGADERASASPIEAADHLGAAFGALVTGVVWLPVYGLSITALLFAALKGAALAGSIAAARRG